MCRVVIEATSELWECHTDGTYLVADFAHLIGPSGLPSVDRRVVIFAESDWKVTGSPLVRDFPAVTVVGRSVWHFGGEETRNLHAERVRIVDDPLGYADWDRLLTEWGTECRALYNDCHVLAGGAWRSEVGVSDPTNTIRLPHMRPMGATPLPCAEEVHRKRQQSKKANTKNVVKRTPMWQLDSRVDITKPPPPPDYNVYYGLKPFPTTKARKSKGFLDKALHKLAEEEYVLQRRRSVLQRSVPRGALERYEAMLDECFSIATKHHMESDSMAPAPVSELFVGEMDSDNVSDRGEETVVIPAGPPTRSRDCTRTPEFGTRFDRLRDTRNRVVTRQDDDDDMPVSLSSHDVEAASGAILKQLKKVY